MGRRHEEAELREGCSVNRGAFCAQAIGETAPLSSPITRSLNTTVDGPSSRGDQCGCAEFEATLKRHRQCRGAASEPEPTMTLSIMIKLSRVQVWGVGAFAVDLDGTAQQSPFVVVIRSSTRTVQGWPSLDCWACRRHAMTMLHGQPSFASGTLSLRMPDLTNVYARDGGGPSTPTTHHSPPSP